MPFSASMASKPLSKLEVHYTNTSTPRNSNTCPNNLPFFLTSSGISGAVNAGVSGTHIKSLRICLEGTLSIRIPQGGRTSYSGGNGGAPYRKLNKRTFILVQNVPTRHYSVCEEHADTPLPFHLDLTDLHGSHRPSESCLKALPPTLYYRKITSSPTSTQAETTEAISSYTLSISAMNGHMVLDTISQPVRIYDNSSLQPPAYQVNTSSNYQSHQTGTLRRNLIANAGTFIAGVTSEPSPLVFDSRNDFATTIIPIEMAAATSNTLSELNAFITWRLRTSTIASLMPLKSGPTTQQTRNTSNTISTSTLGLTHDIKMKLRDWSYVDGTYTSSQNLAIALPKSALLVPTTHTAHISRRYSVQVEISVRGKEVGKTSVRVEAPLQIGYQDTSDMEAPIYQEQDKTEAIVQSEEWLHGGELVSTVVSLPPAYIL